MVFQKVLFQKLHLRIYANQFLTSWIIPLHLSFRILKVGKGREKSTKIWISREGKELFQWNIKHVLGYSGEKSPRRFFNWFWDDLKEEKVFIPVFLLKSFTLNCFYKCNLNFQSVLISLVLISENITKMFHTQQWFYWNSTFQRWILLKLHCLRN